MNTPTPTLDKTRQEILVRLSDSRPMLVRIGSGIVGAGSYSAMVFVTNGLPFAIGVAIFSILGANELYRAVKRQGGQPSELLGYLACVVFQFAAWTRNGASFAPYLPPTFMLLVIATLLVELGKHKPKPILNIGSTLLGSVYVGWLFSYLTLLRGINVPILQLPIHGTTTGEWLVIFVTATTWLSDAGALFIGRGMGKRKLAPTISPSKTLEGSIGGLLLSVVSGAMLGYWLHIPMIHALGLALLCGLAGQIGDLCESVMKRDLGVKDFGAVIPGHGGILDRIDSLLFSAPLAYYYIQFFLIR